MTKDGDAETVGDLIAILQELDPALPVAASTESWEGNYGYSRVSVEVIDGWDYGRDEHLDGRYRRPDCDYKGERKPCRYVMVQA